MKATQVSHNRFVTAKAVLDLLVVFNLTQSLNQDLVRVLKTVCYNIEMWHLLTGFDLGGLHYIILIDDKHIFLVKDLEGGFLWDQQSLLQNHWHQYVSSLTVTQDSFGVWKYGAERDVTRLIVKIRLNCFNDAGVFK